MLLWYLSCSTATYSRHPSSSVRSLLLGASREPRTQIRWGIRGLDDPWNHTELNGEMNYKDSQPNLLWKVAPKIPCSSLLAPRHRSNRNVSKLGILLNNPVCTSTPMAVVLPLCSDTLSSYLESFDLNREGFSLVYNLLRGQICFNVYFPYIGNILWNIIHSKYSHITAPPNFDLSAQGRATSRFWILQNWCIWNSFFLIFHLTRRSNQICMDSKHQN